MTLVSFGSLFLDHSFVLRIVGLAADETGQDLIEYVLVAALVALAAVASLKGLSNKIGNAMTGVGNGLTSAT